MPGGQQKLRIGAVVLRIVAIGHVVADAGADRGPVLVVGRNGQHVRQIDAADKGQAVGDQRVQRRDCLHIERGLGIRIDRRRHAADQETLQVRILAAEQGVDLDEAALKIERLKIVRHRHQIGLRRQSIGGMAPIGVGENAELAALDKGLHAVAHAGEIAWCWTAASPRSIAPASRSWPDRLRAR